MLVVIDLNLSQCFFFKLLIMAVTLTAHPTTITIATELSLGASVVSESPARLVASELSAELVVSELSLEVVVLESSVWLVVSEPSAGLDVSELLANVSSSELQKIVWTYIHTSLIGAC